MLCCSKLVLLSHTMGAIFIRVQSQLQRHQLQKIAIASAIPFAMCEWSWKSSIPIQFQMVTQMTAKNNQDFEKIISCNVLVNKIEIKSPNIKNKLVQIKLPLLQMYDHVASGEIVLVNTGMVGFEFTALGMDPQMASKPQPGVPIMIPHTVSHFKLSEIIQVNDH